LVAAQAYEMVWYGFGGVGVLEVSMSKAGGLLLIALGVGMAVCAMPYYLEDADVSAATAQEINALRDIPATAVRTAKVDEVVSPEPKPAVRPAKVEPAADRRVAASSDSSRSTVVTIASNGTAPISRLGAASGSAAILPGDKVGIARELQRELRRVGCYNGDISGSWTPASRRAMKAFTERVNASLPVDQPDYILLTLVQGRQERACGVPCPDGQTLSDVGRCLPNAVMAAAAKKAAPAANVVGTRKRELAAKSAAGAGWSTTTNVAATTATDPGSSALTEGRMGLAGPHKTELGARNLPEGDSSRLAAVADPTEEATAAKSLTSTGADRQSAYGTTDRQFKGAREKRRERYGGAPRRKFGTWFFRQQDAWNN
jgi:hypothetical protein